MAIDERIPLATQVPNYGRSLSQGLISGAQLAEQPYRNQLLEQRADLQSQSIAQNEQVLAQNSAGMKAQAGAYTYNVLQALKKLPEAERAAAFQTAAPQMKSMKYDKVLGFNADEVEAFDDATIDRLSVAFQPYVAQAQQGGQSGGMRGTPIPFTRGGKNYLGGYIENPGGDPYFQSVEVPGQPTNRMGETPQAATIRVINQAGGVAQAEESVKQAMSPLTAKLIELAKQEGKDLATIARSNRANAKVLKSWEAGLSSLSSSLGNTTTGPLFGLLPVISSSGQVAQGALAQMAPIMKSIFRESGEGTFTKDDQEILMDMLPTIKDSPKARVIKAKNVDMLVRVYLGEDSPIKMMGTVQQDANGNRAVVYPDGSYEEITYGGGK